MKTTRIADSDVPIVPGVLTTVYFSGGQSGEVEAGWWEFWIVFNEQHSGFVARCLRGDDPGNRFRIMQGKKGYEESWKVASTATGIRPAKQHEIMKWLKEHPQDAKYAADI